MTELYAILAGCITGSGVTCITLLIIRFLMHRRNANSATEDGSVHNLPSPIARPTEGPIDPLDDSLDEETFPLPARSLRGEKFVTPASPKLTVLEFLGTSRQTTGTAAELAPEKTV